MALLALGSMALHWDAPCLNNEEGRCFLQVTVAGYVMADALRTQCAVEVCEGPMGVRACWPSFPEEAFLEE